MSSLRKPPRPTDRHVEASSAEARCRAHFRLMGRARICAGLLNHWKEVNQKLNDSQT